MAERVTTLETRTECLPALLHDVDGLKASQDRNRGRVDVLRVLVAIAASSGIVGLVFDYLLLTQHAAVIVK